MLLGQRGLSRIKFNEPIHGADRRCDVLDIHGLVRMWLIPFAQRTKIIPIGQILLMAIPSWPAPLGRRPTELDEVETEASISRINLSSQCVVCAPPVASKAAWTCRCAQIFPIPSLISA